MNERQIKLARHALGLPNKAMRSYRNRFVAGPGHTDYADWAAMVEEKSAKRLKSGGFGESTLFYLTRAGAALALMQGETLDPEDFPLPATSIDEE